MGMKCANKFDSVLLTEVSHKVAFNWHCAYRILSIAQQWRPQLEACFGPADSSKTSLRANKCELL